jgi:2,3-bisphosphoglycerate-independent phosphoglycerate mutase
LTPPRAPAHPRDRFPRALIVLDGLADRGEPGGGRPTPLERASTPHLDRLAAAGQLGQISVLGPGIAPESDAGVFALLGFDPVRDSPGRGVLEAMGAEVALGVGDVALRLNFATLGESGAVLDSRVGRSLGTEEGRELARALTSAELLRDVGIRAEVRSTVGHRGVLWLRPDGGASLSPEISNADPFYERVGGLGHARHPARPVVEQVRPLDGSPAAARTADAVNRLLSRVPAVLEAAPENAARRSAGRPVANGILVRDAGALPTGPMPTFRSRWGVEGAALTEMPVERGIARVLGLADRFVGPMTGNRELGYKERACATCGLVNEFPFVYVHLKGPDEPGHDGDPERKREVIEAIDRSFFGPFLSGIDLAQVRLAVTADHATPCSLHGHSDDPVPLLLAGAGIPASGPSSGGKFGETSAARGSLGSRRGAELLPLLLGETPAASPT